MKSRYLASVLVCAAGLLQAAETSKFILPDPVAVVEGKAIKPAEVQEALNALIARSGKKPEDISDSDKMAGARAVLGNLITQAVVTKRAAGTPVSDEEVDAQFKKIQGQFPDPKQLEEKLPKGMTIDDLKAKIKDGIRQNKWIESQIAGKTEVSAEDVKGFYNTHPEAFKAPEMVRASQILIIVPQGAPAEVVAAKEKAINAAAERIAKGEDFGKVAKEVTEDPGAKEKEGDLDFFPKEQMQALLPEVADASFALKKGEVSKPIKSKFGYHLIKQTDRKEAHTVPLEEAQPKLQDYLSKQKKMQVAQAFLKDLVAKADVKNNLPTEAALETKPAASPEVKADTKADATATPTPKSKKKAKSKE